MIAETALEPPKTTGESTQSKTFLRLIGLFEPAMWRLVGSYFEYEADRNDLFQEIAVALWQAIPTFSGRLQRTHLVLPDRPQCCDHLLSQITEA